MVIQKHYQTKRAVGANALAALSAVAVALFCGSVTASITSSNKPVHAADSPAKVTVSVDEACSLSGHVDTEHTLTNPTIGAWNSGIGTTSITAVCNDAGGYDVYAVGYSNDEWKNTNLINTTDSSITIPTRAYDPSYTSNSYWSMQLSQGTGDKATIVSPYSNYSAVPSDYTKVATYPSNTTGASGSSFKTTYGVYITPTQAIGTYQGQVKYTLVHPNGADAPEAKDPSICDTETCMQDLDSTSIAALLPSVSSTATVYDSRDEQAYKIAKLADGKYWMVDSLNLAGGTALSSDDTAFDSSYTLPTTNGWTKSADGKLVMPASATKNSGNNNLTDSSQFGTDNYAYVFNSGNKTDCGALNQNTPCYSYYSWDTATVGSGRSIASENTDAPYSICPKKWRLPTSGNHQSNGWKRGDFYTLATAYGANLESQYYESSSTFYNNAGPGTAPNFLLAGYYSGGSFYTGGSVGLYWSGTSYGSSTNARDLLFYSSYVSSAGSYGRRYGFSVRCVFGG